MDLEHYYEYYYPDCSLTSAYLREHLLTIWGQYKNSEYWLAERVISRTLRHLTYKQDANGRDDTDNLRDKRYYHR